MTTEYTVGLRRQTRSKAHDAEVIGEPVLGGLHHVYHLAAFDGAPTCTLIS